MKKKLKNGSKRKREVTLEFQDGSRKIKVSSVKKLGFFGKGFGLMFRRRERALALLFEFNKPVNFHLTSLFVFFPFVVVWLDSDNKVLDKKIVGPWKFTVSSSVNSYSKILEIPLNNFYSSSVKKIL